MTDHPLKDAILKWMNDPFTDVHKSLLFIINKAEKPISTNEIYAIKIEMDGRLAKADLGSVDVHDIDGYNTKHVMSLAFELKNQPKGLDGSFALTVRFDEARYNFFMEKFNTMGPVNKSALIPYFLQKELYPILLKYCSGNY